MYQFKTAAGMRWIQYDNMSKVVFVVSGNGTGWVFKGSYTHFVRII